MFITEPWFLISAVSASLAICLMLGLKLISPKRFAQGLAGLYAGLTIALALSRLSLGGNHG